MIEQNNPINSKKGRCKGLLIVCLALFILTVFGGWCVAENQKINLLSELIEAIKNNSEILESLRIGLIVFLAVLMLSGRSVLSGMITLSMFGLILAGSLNKIHYLGTPLTVADLHFFFDKPKENFDLFFNYPLLGILILSSIFFIVLISYLILKSEKRKGPSQIILTLLLICILSLVYQSSEIKASSINVSSNNYFRLDENQNKIVFDKAYRANLEQQDYQSSIIDLISIFFKKRSTSLSIPEKIQNTLFDEIDKKDIQIIEEDRPDIIAILNESLFNPKALDACDATELCSFEIFDGNKNYPGIYGPLFVHTHGGGTWLSEFAFLSGYDWRVFGEGGAYAPRTIAPHIHSSLAIHLKKLGYRTVAIYPVAGNFLNAREAYKNYGFDEFYAIEDLGITTDWKSTSDSAIFKKSIETVEKFKNDKPLFLFILTIYNHGPHAEKIDAIENVSSDFLRKASGLPAPLIDYISRLKETNDAIIKLKNDWLGSERKRVFVWFGDHQPLFSKALKSSKKFSRETLGVFPKALNTRYLTWYEITSNFMNREISKNPTPTDLAFLETRLLEYSKLPLREHGSLTLKLSNICPLGIVYCDDEKLVDEYLSLRVWDLKEIQLPH